MTHDMYVSHLICENPKTGNSGRCRSVLQIKCGVCCKSSVECVASEVAFSQEWFGISCMAGSFFVHLFFVFNRRQWEERECAADQVAFS